MIYLQKFSAMLYTKDENVYARSLNYYASNLTFYNVEQLFEFEALFQLLKHIFIICILHSGNYFCSKSLCIQ